MTVKEFTESTREIACSPGMDPNSGAWDGYGLCCIGARLAYHFDVATGYIEDFQLGACHAAEALGGNVGHLIVLLRNAGAGFNPFSYHDWPTPVEEVWDNLAKFEDLPSLRGENFAGYEL